MRGQIATTCQQTHSSNYTLHQYRTSRGQIATTRCFSTARCRQIAELAETELGSDRSSPRSSTPDLSTSKNIAP
eukprot:516304-Rhodomonas_salina.1